MLPSYKPSKILVVSDSFHDLPEAVEILTSTDHEVDFVPYLTRPQDIDPRSVKVPPAEAEALVMGRVMRIDRAALDALPRARVIALHTSGTDNVDLDLATERGVLVTNVRGVNGEQCADLAMGLILATTRQIVRGDKAIRLGKWASETGKSGDVTGATLGIIGLGQIGRALARRAVGFDMKLLVNTRTPDHALGARLGIDYVDLDALLERSDIVALTASLTPQTRGMITERELRRMKPSAHFVNVARGEMVDEAALHRALREGWIAGAGIDVFDVEPLHASPLFELDNIVVTPHQAGLTGRAMVNAAARAARNALRVLAGEVPEDAVNPDAARSKGVSR